MQTSLALANSSVRIAYSINYRNANTMHLTGKGLLCNSHNNPFILVQYQQCFNGTDDLLDLANVSHNKEITSCITLVLTGVTGS